MQEPLKPDSELMRSCARRALENHLSGARRLNEAELAWARGVLRGRRVDPPVRRKQPDELPACWGSF